MMLAYYYSKGADFKQLFDNMKISESPSYLEHLNKHNVIYITFNELPKANCSYEEFIENYTKDLTNDIKEAFLEININELKPLSKIFTKVYNETGEGFVFIIDEWDYIFNNNLFSKDDRKNFWGF